MAVAGGVAVEGADGVAGWLSSQNEAGARTGGLSGPALARSARVGGGGGGAKSAVGGGGGARSTDGVGDGDNGKAVVSDTPSSSSSSSADETATIASVAAHVARAWSDDAGGGWTAAAAGDGSGGWGCALSSPLSVPRADGVTAGLAAAAPLRPNVADGGVGLGLGLGLGVGLKPQFGHSI